MKQLEDSLLPIFDLKPRWTGINSLFYEGPLDVLIHIRHHNNPNFGDGYPDGDFNIFSMEKAREVCGKYGYKVNFEPFFPLRTFRKGLTETVEHSL